jgi:RNA polymerase sigma-70 factor, ECF subfamily
LTTAHGTPAAGDLVAVLPYLRRFARVLTGEVGDADGLLIETLEHWKDGSPARAPQKTLRGPLFALMHKLYLGNSAGVGRSVPAMDASRAWSSARAEPSGLLADFAHLPIEEREVLLLVAVERMTYEEVAYVLYVPLATVIIRLRRARDLMRAAGSNDSQSDVR